MAGFTQAWTKRFFVVNWRSLEEPRSAKLGLSHFYSEFFSLSWVTLNFKGLLVVGAPDILIHCSHCCLQSKSIFCFHAGFRIFLKSFYFMHFLLFFDFVSLSSPGSLPRWVQVQGEFAPQQLQCLRVSGLQRLLHCTQQAWPHQEGQQGYHCHDCNALPTQNMTSKDC